MKARRIERFHWMRLKTGDQHRGRDLHLVTLTGIADFDLVGNSEKSWNNKSLEITPMSVKKPLEAIPLPQKLDRRREWQQGRWQSPTSYEPVYLIKEWKATAGLNAVYNRQSSNFSGHAVGTPDILTADLVAEKHYFLSSPDDAVSLHCEIGARDKDAHLYKIAFQLDMLVCFAGYAHKI